MKDIKKSNDFWFTLKIGNLRTLAGDEKLNIHPKPLWELDFTHLCVFTSNPFQWNPTCLQSFWMDFCFSELQPLCILSYQGTNQLTKKNPKSKSRFVKYFFSPVLSDCPISNVPLIGGIKSSVIMDITLSHFLWKSSRSYKKNIARIANAVQVTIWL